MIHAIEICSCAGGMALGFRRAGIEFDMVVDKDEEACASYRHNLGHDPIRMDLRDLLRLAESGWHPGGGVLDLIVADPPCFPTGTRITTSRGRVPIEEIRVGDVVLTHVGRWRSVTETFARPYTGLFVRLEVAYLPRPVTCTPEHPLYVRRRIIEGRSWRYDKPQWVPASDVAVGDAVLFPRNWDARPIPELTIRTRCYRKDRTPIGGHHEISTTPCRVDILADDVAWILGLYLAEGHRRGREPDLDRGGMTRREVVFSVARHEAVDVAARLKAAGEHGIVSDHGQGASRVVLNSPDWWALCGEFGDGAGAKFIPEWAFTMSASWREALLDGYFYGDGHSRPNSGGGTIKETPTISEDLAWGVARLVAVTMDIVAGVRRCAAAVTRTIQGRTVQCSDCWRVRWSPRTNRRRQGIVDHEGAWMPVTETVRSEASATVYNLEVDEDHSYVADGVAAHNCQPWSTAGKQRGLGDDRDCLRPLIALVEILRPRAFLLGNVPGLEHANAAEALAGTVGALSYRGYCVDHIVLDAADYGVPQRRIRPFWFAHRGGPCITWPSPTHGPPTTQLEIGGTELASWVTCRQALCDLPLAELGKVRTVRPHKERNTVFPGPRSIGPPTRSSRRTQGAHGGGGILKVHPRHPPSEVDEPSRTICARHDGGFGGGDVLKVMESGFPPSHIDEPGCTVTTRESGGGNRMLVEPLTANAKHPASRPDAPSHTVAAKARGNGGSILEWPWDRPATTVCGENWIPQPGHTHTRMDKYAGKPYQGWRAVVLSEHARARLQGFPDWLCGCNGGFPLDQLESLGRSMEDGSGPDVQISEVCQTCWLPRRRWRFVGKTKGSRNGQIGMAVPPPLAEAIGRSVMQWFIDVDGAST